MIIPLSISFYLGKNSITCRRKKEEKNSMKLGFLAGVALLFLLVVGFVTLSEGVLPRYIAAMQDGGQSCILVVGRCVILVPVKVVERFCCNLLPSLN